MLKSSINNYPLSHYRCDAIEYLKAFAIILFLYMQTQRGLFRAGLPIGNEFIHLFDSILNTIIIPLGFAITGWVFATIGQHYTKKDNTLTLIDVVIYPYVLWVILQAFLQTQFNFLTQSNHSIVHIISLLPIEPYGHFSALYSTFFCALFCILIIRQQTIPFFIIGLTASAALYLTIDSDNYITIISIIAPHLFFFVLGAGLSTIKHKILSASLALGIFSLLALIFSQGLFHVVFKNEPYIYSWQVLLVATTSIISLFVFFGAISRFKSHRLLFIGKAAFAIYLLHFLLIGGTRLFLIDILSIKHIWINLITAIITAFIGGLVVYSISQRFRMHFLWRAPHFLNTHLIAEKTSQPIILGLVILLASPFIGLYTLSEAKIKQKYPIELPSSKILLSSAPEDIANGKRLAQVYGCYLGCHAPKMEGQTLEEKVFEGRIVSPNLTKSVQKYSADELAVIIRQGLRPNNTSLRGWMPSEAYQYIDDKSLSDILSFIASAPLQNKTPKPYRSGWLSRFNIVTGKHKNHHQMAKEFSYDINTMSTGEKLVRSACGECHGVDLLGRGIAPPLSIAKAYSFEDFQKLQRTGIALGDREVSLMSLVARNRFSLLTDSELRDIYQFLSEFE